MKVIFLAAAIAVMLLVIHLPALAAGFVPLAEAL